MKLTRSGAFLGIGALFSLVMAIFSFFAWGWFSDRGFQFYFEIPIRTESGWLNTLTDIVSTVAPFLLLLGFLLLFWGNSPAIRRLALFFAALPMTLSACLQLFSFLSKEDGHFTLMITLFFLLLSGGLSIASGFLPELRRFAGQLSLFHAGLETVLVVISAIFQEKYSQFYFSQLLPMGRYSNFRYSFFIISVFLFYLSYSLALAFLHFSGDGTQPPFTRKLPSVPAEAPTPEMETDAPEEEEDAIPLTLEDLGIEK